MRDGSIKLRKKNAQKTKSIERCGFEAGDRGNYHKSQRKLEKTKEGEVHDREILVSKIQLNLPQFGTVVHHTSQYLCYRTDSYAQN